MARYSLQSAVRQVRGRVLATIGIGTAVIVAWWMRVEDARIPELAPAVVFGESVKVGRAVFIPQKLSVVQGKVQGERKLVLTGLIESVTGTTQTAVFGFPEQLPELSSGGMIFPAPKVILARDNYPLVQLQPRIRETITLVWDVEPLWRDMEVSIKFSAQHFKLNDNLYSKASWLLFYPTGSLKARPEQGT